MCDTSCLPFVSSHARWLKRGAGCPTLTVSIQPCSFCARASQAAAAVTSALARSTRRWAAAR